jgi:hypothetical protein
MVHSSHEAMWYRPLAGAESHNSCRDAPMISIMAGGLVIDTHDLIERTSEDREQQGDKPVDPTALEPMIPQMRRLLSRRVREERVEAIAPSELS